MASDLCGKEKTRRLRLLDTRTGLTLARIIVIVGIGAAWEIASARLVDPFFISAPSRVAATLWRWVLDGTLSRHTLATVWEMVLGFAVGGLAGILMGIVLGIVPTLSRILDPVIVAVYSLPKIALAPLFILWFGIGLLSKIMLVVTLVFFLVFYSTLAGVRKVSMELKQVLAVIGATRSDLVMRLVLPSALPEILLGLKIAAPYALVGAVVAELIASTHGLGWLLWRATGLMDTDGVFAVLFVLMVIAVLLDGLFAIADRRFFRWRGRG